MTGVATTPSLQSFFRQNSDRVHAVRPALGFRTGISKTLLYPGYMENQCIAVAADGSVWTMTRDNLAQYDVGTSELKALCSITLYRRGPFSFPQHLAPVSYQRAYFIQSGNNQPVVFLYQQDEELQQLPSLPDTDLPVAITAASDNTVWVLGRSGKAWNYQAGTRSWLKTEADAGVQLKQLSVGAADFVLAIAKQNGMDTVLRLKDGKFIQHDQFPHSGVSWIGACEGKEYWWSSADMQRGGELHLLADGKIKQSFQVSTGVSGLTAATSRSCYFFSMEQMHFVRAALGVMDQQSQSWPSQTAGQQKAYNKISELLGIKNPDGLRSQYSNINTTFSILYSQLRDLRRPDTINEADWNSVKTQLSDELEYVQAVTTLAGNLTTLNLHIGQIYTNTYNKVVSMLGLPDKPADQSKTIVTLLLDQLLGKLEGAVIGKVKTQVASEVVDIAVACFKYANDQLAKKHKLADGSVPLKIACADLAGTLADMVVESEKSRSEIQSTIVKDWGKLSACGEAIRSGVWFWSPNTNYEKIKDAGVAIELSFYQTLMPVKFKIVLCQGILYISPHLTLDPFMHNVPGYALMYKMEKKGDAEGIFWWAACTEVGAEVIQQTKGPFPNQKLLEAVFALETRAEDFFAGTAGWNLPVAVVPGYLPPPAHLNWQTYVNTDQAFK